MGGGREGVERSERGTKSQRGGEGKSECNGKGTQGTLEREGSILIFVHPEFLVTPMWMGAVCLLGQGRFEDSVSHCLLLASRQYW